MRRSKIYQSLFKGDKMMKKDKENMIVPFTTATTNIELPLIDKGLNESYDTTYDPYTMQPV